MSKFHDDNGENMDTSPDFLVVMFQAHHSAKVPSTNRILSQNPTTNQPSNMKDDQFNSNKDPTSFEFEHLGFKTLFTKEKSNLYEQIASKFQFDRFKQIPNISGKTKQQAVKPKAKKTSELKRGSQNDINILKGKLYIIIIMFIIRALEP